MRRRDFLVSMSGAATLVMASHLPVEASRRRGRDRSRERAHVILHAQERYERVLRDRLGDPYSAPLHNDPDGERYLWGGLDPIETVRRWQDRIIDDPGGVIFISERNLGDPQHTLQVPLFRDGPTLPAIFVSEENLAGFDEQYHEGTFMVLCGLNCLWGIVSGPATERWSRPRHSHWAQPGLAAIVVEEFRRPGTTQSVTALGANLYRRGDDWNATPERWEMVVTAFEDLLETGDLWERRRPFVPILEYPG